MKFLGGFTIMFVSCLVITLSIWLGIYRIEYHNGALRFTKDSPGNRTGEVVSEFEDEDYMSISMRASLREDTELSYSLLEEDYYRDSCPSVERIIRKTIRHLHKVRPSIAPSLIRLLFHDCFVEGCDASVLLDSDESMSSEKEASPNLSLKGFDVIDAIKSELENVCPGVVSCADLLVLAAREAVKVVGGPRYSLKTGRRDSLLAFKNKAETHLPSPHASLSEILASFESKGFNERELVSLSGAHSIGITHCTFFEDRLYNFSGTGKPDPELNSEFRQELKAKCPFSAPASSPSPYLHASGKTDGVIDLSFNNEGGDAGFGTRYFNKLLERKGVLFSDQQLMAQEVTARWVRAYASDPELFRQDFSAAMVKLSSSRILTGDFGEARLTCSKVNPPV